MSSQLESMPYTLSRLLWSASRHYGTFKDPQSSGNAASKLLVYRRLPKKSIRSPEEALPGVRDWALALALTRQCSATSEHSCLRQKGTAA